MALGSCERRLMRRVLIMLALGGCAHASHLAVTPSCLVATPATVAGQVAEPQWIRFRDTNGDTSGTAVAGLYGSAQLDGHWWRVGSDSLRVDASDSFNALWLRVEVKSGKASGQATIHTDNLGAPQPARTWHGQVGQWPE